MPSIIDCELNLFLFKMLSKINSKSFKENIKSQNVYEKENTTNRIYNKILNLINNKNKIKKFYLND